jgi:hypothetical protein
MVVDSIQTVFLPGLESAPGSVSQVRECAARLMLWSKGRGTATFLVGHVTKDGAIAGPRVLEHLVDTVLYFEGEQHHAYRVLRAVKNRFGSTNEIGVFEMGEQGLAEVTNPSGFFLAERPRGAAGSVIVSSLEGSRPLLLELQALVTPASFGTPRRTVLGARPQTGFCVCCWRCSEKRVGFRHRARTSSSMCWRRRLTGPAADLAWSWRSPERSTARCGRHGDHGRSRPGGRGARGGRFAARLRRRRPWLHGQRWCRRTISPVIAQGGATAAQYPGSGWGGRSVKGLLGH